jgi:hypothetical protein
VKHKMVVLCAAFAGVALTLVTLTPSYSLATGNVHVLAATQAATVAVPTTQCGLIDALVVDSLATPGATQGATRVMAPTKQATQQATKQTASTVPTIPPTATPAEGGPGEAAGGDEALTTYRDSIRNFSIGYPRSWSQEATFQSGVCLTGRDASIAVQFVQGTPPADLMAYVKADEANVQAKSAGYKQVYLKASADVKGAVILGYEWDAGRSTVTEKPVRARTDRYYFIDTLGRFVIVSETEAIKQFDPDGVRDTVLTYQASQ